MNHSRRLRASDLHDAARELLDRELAKYGFTPAGGYTEGAKASHLYRGGDRFVLFGIDDQGSGAGSVQIGLAAEDAPISSEHSINLAELMCARGLETPRFGLKSAWEFAKSSLEALVRGAPEFLAGDVRTFVHDHAKCKNISVPAELVHPSN